mmetsp:Transcript_7676/g.21796  ORF Transcript_7676/g.21796 Transcript_7676/m.21796 type:complete len:313 (-) Transcript_7676:1397-2335(-)
MALVVRGNLATWGTFALDPSPGATLITSLMVQFLFRGILPVAYLLCAGIAGRMLLQRYRARSLRTTQAWVLGPSAISIGFLGVLGFFGTDFITPTFSFEFTILVFSELFGVGLGVQIFLAISYRQLCIASQLGAKSCSRSERLRQRLSSGFAALVMSLDVLYLLSILMLSKAYIEASAVLLPLLWIVLQVLTSVLVIGQTVQMRKILRAVARVDEQADMLQIVSAMLERRIRKWVRVSALAAVLMSLCSALFASGVIEHGGPAVLVLGLFCFKLCRITLALANIMCISPIQRPSIRPTLCVVKGTTKKTLPS